MNALPIPLSSLKPSDAEIDETRKFQRNEFAKSIDFAELAEAFANNLTDEDEKIVMDLVRESRDAKLKHGNMSLFPLAIGIFVVNAFIKHVNQYAEYDLNAFLDGYADRQAEELRERGVLVDCAA